MDVLPEIIAKSAGERSRRPPITSRVDPDFGKAWLVWDIDDQPDDPLRHEMGYAELVEWLGVVELPGYDPALLRVGRIDHGEQNLAEFEALYQSRLPEVSERTRALYRRVLSSAVAVLARVQAKLLKTEKISFGKAKLSPREFWIVKDEVIVVCQAGSVSVDCRIENEDLDIYIERVLG